MATDPSWRALLLIVLIALLWAWESRQHRRSNSSAVQQQRLLKPGTPADCPACRQHAAPTDNTMAGPR